MQKEYLCHENTSFAIINLDFNMHGKLAYIHKFKSKTCFM